jgi:hypothetical protein
VHTGFLKENRKYIPEEGGGAGNEKTSEAQQVLGYKDLSHEGKSCRMSLKSVLVVGKI